MDNNENRRKRPQEGMTPEERARRRAERQSRMKSQDERQSESSNNIIRIAMFVFAILLLFVVIFYAMRLFGGSNDEPNTPEVIDSTDENGQDPTDVLDNTVEETNTESDMESIGDSTDETATESESESETEAETEAETSAETGAETEAETQAETESETEAETEAETQAETEAETTNDSRTNFTPVEVGAYESTARASVADIQSATDAELVEMIIQGELGYGWERVDLLQKAGINPDYMSALVTQRMRELGY